MNSSSDADPLPSGRIPEVATNSASEPCSNWREALLTLLASRISLIQLESKDASRSVIRMIALIVAAALCVVFAWALSIAGIVALISTSTQWPWHWVAMAAGGIHLLAGILLANMSKPSEGSAYPITRAEFQKDREWIENFQKARKSND